ncbi:MAG: UDP-N-acetylmuramate dehydrogenase [Candidatus Cloacimonetes bacterium]|nr:UDP-N-acetylmuramate dehydrogenase [Candidatus Cloacimonadota bacterium]
MKKEIEIIKRNVPLKSHCSFQIGGRAKFFAEPENYEELLNVLEFTRKNSLQPFFFGFGSNLLFPDTPDKATCFISLKKMNSFQIEEEQLITLCGMPLSMLAVIGSLLGTEDFDFTYLLPGSIGAGLYINARYFEREMSQIVREIKYIDLNDLNRGIQTINVADCEYGYKISIFQKKPWLIISARLTLPENAKISGVKLEVIRNFLQTESNYTASLSVFFDFFKELVVRLKTKNSQQIRLREIEKQRNKYRHFEFPSAGSVFKNIRELGKPIGQIIDELGMKGTRSGDAMISPYHGNIIINLGKGRAIDVINLIDKMSKSIFKAHGLRPETEITIVK